MTDTTAAAPVDTTEAPPEADTPETDGGEEGEAPPPKATDDRETRSHRSLNRKHEKLTRDLATLREQRESLEKERGALSEDRQLASRFRELSELVKRDPLAAARAFGLDYDSITKEMLEESSLSDSERTMRRELAELKREREESKRRDEQTAEQRRREGVRASVSATLVELAKGDATTFRFTSQIDAPGLLRKLDDLADEAKAQGITIDPGSKDDLLEALEVIEKRQAKKAEKWRKLLGLTATQAAAKVVAEDAKGAPAGRRTLSSRDTNDSAKTPQKTMTKEERKAWAIAALDELPAK